MIGDETYDGLLKEAFGDGPRVERIAAFVRAMRLRTVKSARDNVQCREIVDFGMMRGQISICDELMEWGEMALDSADGHAGPDADDGIPDLLHG